MPKNVVTYIDLFAGLGGIRLLANIRMVFYKR